MCVIGAYSAGDVRTLWGGLLRQVLCPQRVVLVPQIDPVGRQGIRVGLDAFRHCSLELKGIDVRWWPWRRTLQAIGMTPETWDRSGWTDLGDLAKHGHGDVIRRLAGDI